MAPSGSGVSDAQRVHGSPFGSGSQDEAPAPVCEGSLRAISSGTVPQTPALLSRLVGPALLAAAAGLALTAGPVAAQESPPVPAPEPAPAPVPAEDPEGRPVVQVDVLELVERGGASEPEQTRPASGATEQFARNQIRTEVGQPFRRATITEDLSRLNRTGHYRFVEARIDDEPGAVRVTFVIQPQPIIRDVQVVGNRQISDQDLAAEVDVLVGTPVDRQQIDVLARRIEGLYREKGFYLATVDWDEQELEENGFVLFVIREGERLKITGLKFLGAEAFSDRELRREVESETAFWFIRKGRLDDERLDSDVAALYNHYRNHGYLDVRVDRRLQLAPNNREAIVEFLIDEGPLYTLRRVDAEFIDAETSAPQMTAEQITGKMELKPGDVYSLNTLRDSVDRVRDAYQAMGYSDVRVETRERRDEHEPVVDVLFLVVQGPAFRFGEVTVTGNDITQSKVILRRAELANVRPGQPASQTSMDRLEARLRRDRLFDTLQDPPNVSVAPPRPEDPGTRDVFVEVAETNTGEFNIGAAISSDAGVVGRLGVVQRNFDVGDFPDSAGDLFSGRAFRGAGQTLRLDLAPGDRVQTYSLSLSEPALLESDYTAAGSIYYREREYAEFDEQRIGTRLTLGRNFGTRWTGTGAFRLESVDLSDIDEDVPVDVFEVEDQSIITGLGFALARQTYDDPFRPSRGSRTELGMEQVGILGGDFDFTRLQAEHTLFIPVFEDYLDRRTVLQLTGAAGYMPQGQDEVPVYERFYRGGRSFRGFAFRNVSPKGIRADTLEQGDDPVGGIFDFFMGAELTHPIYEELFSLAAFVDSGTVDEEVTFENYRVSAGLGVRLYIPQLSPAPLAFDFGWPILSQEGDRDRLFTFSIDLPF